MKLLSEWSRAVGSRDGGPWDEWYATFRMGGGWRPRSGRFYLPVIPFRGMPIPSVRLQLAKRSPVSAAGDAMVQRPEKQRARAKGEIPTVRPGKHTTPTLALKAGRTLD